MEDELNTNREVSRLCGVVGYYWQTTFFEEEEVSRLCGVVGYYWQTTFFEEEETNSYKTSDRCADRLLAEDHLFHFDDLQDVVGTRLKLTRSHSLIDAS